MKKNFTMISTVSAVLLVSVWTQNGMAAERRLIQTSLSEPGEMTETASYIYYGEGTEYEGRLKNIEDNPDGESGIITFHYDNLATRNKVELTAGGPMWRQYTATLFIGPNGYVERAEYEYPYMAESGVISFEYDEAGHLTYTRIVEDNETIEYTLTYTADNLTQVRYTETENNIIEEGYTAEFSYSGVPNKGELMYYDEMFGLELDVMEYAYFAGLLGIASRELPTGVMIHDEDETETGSCVWTLDADDYPTKLVAGDETMLFTWSEISGIEEVIGETDSRLLIYGADGVSRTTLGDGFNIMRYTDGRTVKVLRCH
ncbi:MAG: DUF4595 domain-containing protein [Muribaculaceae bacterium]|nr:DUF4595 domain-containing protein [Muribaculaceae bacterium]